MPFVNPNGDSSFWYQGDTSTLISYSSSTEIDLNSQSFWDVNQPTGFLYPSNLEYQVNNPRTYYVLIGFD